MEAGRSIDVGGQGIIRIQSQSPYELLDPETFQWVKHLKQMWPLLKKCDITTQMLHNFFSNSQNPYKAALQVMVSSGDFYSGKQNSLAYNVIESFSEWLKAEKSTCSYLLTKDLKCDAFSLVTNQKNQGLIMLVINVFEMLEDRELYLDQIHHLISTHKYKEACQCATLLKLHKHFKLEDFVIPLVIQDKFGVAVSFLEGSTSHQIELARFLDDLLGKRNIGAELDCIVHKLKITEAKVGKMYNKPLSKLLGRLIKTFNISPSVCPNLTQKKGKGALQFLLNKRFIEKSIGEDGWAEMALEAIGDDQNLQVELVDGVAMYGDLKEALNWAKKFEIPKSEWPFMLREYSEREKNSGSQYACEENWDEPQHSVPEAKFHQLSIPESHIHWIDTAADFSAFIKDVSDGVSVVGFDAEWKPTFGFKKCDLSLIQVATQNNIYILDMIALGFAAPQTLWENFATALFGNVNILKLGFGINEDLILIKETLKKFHSIKMSDSGFLDLALLWRTLVCEYEFVFPFPAVSDSSKGLSGLIELCLGEKLDKSDQFSNWENRPLRKSQILYAALDAYCLLEAYNIIVTEAESQSIPISEVINDVTNEQTPKKVEKKKKKKPSRQAGASRRQNRSFEKKTIYDPQSSRLPST